jgi:hypothetical protein
MAFQCVQHNKRIEILVDMDYRQLGKIDKWGISTVGVYQQLGCINSLGESTVWNVNKQLFMFTKCKQTLLPCCTCFAPTGVVASLSLL